MNPIAICIAIYFAIRIDICIDIRVPIGMCLYIPLPETLQKHGEEKNDSQKGRKNHRRRLKAVAKKEQETALQSFPF